MLSPRIGSDSSRLAAAHVEMKWEPTKDGYAVLFSYPLDFAFVCPAGVFLLNRSMYNAGLIRKRYSIQ